jgi:hypothetical protein
VTEAAKIWPHHEVGRDQVSPRVSTAVTYAEVTEGVRSAQATYAQSLDGGRIDDLAAAFTGWSPGPRSACRGCSPRAWSPGTRAAADPQPSSGEECR